MKEWPWGNVLNHLAMAQEQFREILDIVSHVEKGDFLALSHVSRAKLIPEEQAANLVTQVAAKQDICQVNNNGYFQRNGYGFTEFTFLFSEIRCRL